MTVYADAKVIFAKSKMQKRDIVDTKSTLFRELTPRALENDPFLLCGGGAHRAWTYSEVAD